MWTEVTALELLAGGSCNVLAFIQSGTRPLPDRLIISDKLRLPLFISLLRTHKSMETIFSVQPIGGITQRSIKNAIGVLRLESDNVKPGPHARPQVVRRVGAKTESPAYALWVQANDRIWGRGEY